MKEKNNIKLNERESAVLRALVYEYISTGKPVGSRSFVQKYSFNISPATMRNIMFDLESFGYLCQPHTSAGRIPTDMGYRYYVNSLLENYHDLKNKKPVIKEDVIQKEVHLDKMFTSVAKMLSSLTNYAGIVLTPKQDFTVIKYVELVKLDLNDILIVIVSRTGMIINKRISISENVPQDKLHSYSKFLTMVLAGYSIMSIRSSLIDELRKTTISNSDNQLALDIAEIALSECTEQQIYIEGIENILHLPEMLEEARLKSFLYLLEDKKKLSGIINGILNRDSITTLIGSEINDANINECSIISSSYKIGNTNVGAIGVLGPTRLDYEKAIPLIDYTSKALSSLLNKMSR